MIGLCLAVRLFVCLDFSRLSFGFLLACIWVVDSDPGLGFVCLDFSWLSFGLGQWPEFWGLGVRLGESLAFGLGRGLVIVLGSRARIADSDTILVGYSWGFGVPAGLDQAKRG